MAAPQIRSFKPRDKTYLNEWDLCLHGAIQAGAQHPAEFRMAFAQNKIAIQVETKNRDAKNNGRFEIVVPYVSAIGMLVALDELLKDPECKKIQYKIKGHVFFSGKRSDEPVQKGALTIGRDSENILYMGLSGKDITPIKFTFSVLFDELVIGEATSAQKASEFAAKVFYMSYIGLLPVVAGMNYAPPEPKNPQGGGNGGGSSWGSNQGGNNQTSANGRGDQGGQGGGSMAATTLDFDSDFPL